MCLIYVFEAALVCRSSRQSESPDRWAYAESGCSKTNGVKCLGAEAAS
jgi:hypothetical protein